MKGPELNLSVSGNAVTVNITKGKKSVIAEDLQVSEKDSKRIIRYLHENFATLTHEITSVSTCLVMRPSLLPIEVHSFVFLASERRYEGDPFINKNCMRAKKYAFVSLII